MTLSVSLCASGITSSLLYPHYIYFGFVVTEMKTPNVTKLHMVSSFTKIIGIGDYHALMEKILRIMWYFFSHTEMQNLILSRWKTGDRHQIDVYQSIDIISYI